ncbi:MAG: formylglycine-generating enzyme family protein [Treponema sp.]|nr:formylglycine-generating enzyme family protein [Treponema sp.]
MKKNLFCVWCRGGVLVACVLSLLLVSCGGGGGGSDDYEAPVAENGGGATSEPAVVVTGGITGSQVFINGRTVEIWATWCCDHEVTQEEYELYCRYGGSQPHSPYGDGDNYPAYFVSWYDAIAYCNKRSLAENLTPCYTVNGVDFSGEVNVPTSNDDTWNAAECDFTANGYRLPTEAEWEYFARGGNITNSGQTDYSGSDIIGNVAWYYENAFSVGESDPDYGKHPVKTKAKNSLNLYDMTGNVWEWCWDWNDSISASTPSSGPSSGSYRVVRGGGWLDDASICYVKYRSGYVPRVTAEFIGFRVVRTAD